MPLRRLRHRPGLAGHAGAGAHYRQWWTMFDVEVQRVAGQRTCWTEDDCCISEATRHGRHIGAFPASSRRTGRSCSRSSS
ncbi:hypothetical protein [Reyranella sp.]|uniref:hypothetical protein n=1 Tax=Reyranella sp. TaxID=1929291 RepID=UPI002F946494